MLTTILCFTRNGALLCERLRDLFDPIECYSRYDSGSMLLPLKDDLKGIIQNAFSHSEAIIFIGAAGIAVRLIAPYITSKDKDPAVIVMDEKGKYIIPILSGHLGGANQMAIRIADQIGGQAVITTATDCNQVFAVDVWAKEQGLYLPDISSIKYISAALLKGEKIGFVCVYPIESELPGFILRKDEEVSEVEAETETESKAVTEEVEAKTETETEAKAKAETEVEVDAEVEAGIVISVDRAKKPFRYTLTLIPKNYVIGIGCRKNTDPKLFEDTVIRILEAAGVDLNYVKAVASIDLKAEETAILAFCEKYRLPFQVYTSETLNQAKGDFTSSDFVKSITGVDNICERAAYHASNNGDMILKKTCNQGITVAVAKMDWRCRF